MAYWGMAMANVNNAKRAKEFLKEARKRVEGVSARERLYIDALGAFYQEGENDKARKRAWLTGLEGIRGSIRRIWTHGRGRRWCRGRTRGRTRRSSERRLRN